MALSESLIAQSKRELLDTKCAVCGSFKESGRALCRVCFFSLPTKKRDVLTGARDSTIGSEYAAAYDEIKDYLRIEMDRGKTASGPEDK